MIPSEQTNTGYLTELTTPTNTLEPFHWNFMMAPSEQEATPVERHEMMNPLEEDVHDTQQRRLNEWKMKNRDPEFKLAKRDELHISLGVPKPIGIEIHNWAEEQDWPEGTELETIEEYHITMLYAPEGHDHKDDSWVDHKSHAVSIKEIESFPSKEKGEDKDAIVLTVASETTRRHHEELAHNAEEAGIEISPFSFDDFKPHMTIAYGSLPKGLKPPKLTFETEISAVSPPRPDDDEIQEAHKKDGDQDEDEDIKQAHTWRIARVRPPFEAELLKFSADWDEDEPVWGDEGLAMGRPVHGPLYHLAPTEDRARIQAHGLMAARPGINPRYDNLKGNGMPRFDTQPQGVYVTKEIQGTKVALDSPYDIWEVNPQHVRKLLTDPHAPNYWGVIPHDVPPEGLTMHTPADSGLWDIHGVDPLDPLPKWNPEDEKGYVKRLSPLPSEWNIGQPTAKTADSWSPKDSPPSGLRERAFEPASPDCTCKDGRKLDCPCHGMNPVLPTYEHTFEFPNPASPVGYDYKGDGVRTWMRAETSWHFADEIDTRQYQDARQMPPTTMQEPVQGKPHPESEMIGCTCEKPNGKLSCPVHGLNPDPEQQGYDHSWSIPEGHPVNFPDAQPRSYMKNEGMVRPNTHNSDSNVFDSGCSPVQYELPIGNYLENKDRRYQSDQVNTRDRASLPYPQGIGRSYSNEDQYKYLDLHNLDSRDDWDYDNGLGTNSTLYKEDDSINHELSNGPGRGSHKKSNLPIGEYNLESSFGFHKRIDKDTRDYRAQSDRLLQSRSSSQKLAPQREGASLDLMDHPYVSNDDNAYRTSREPLLDEDTLQSNTVWTFPYISTSLHQESKEDIRELSLQDQPRAYMKAEGAFDRKELEEEGYSPYEIEVLDSLESNPKQWKPGTRGKAIITPEGKSYEWSLEPVPEGQKAFMGGPHHGAVEAMLGLEESQEGQHLKGDIFPNGVGEPLLGDRALTAYWNRPLSAEAWSFGRGKDTPSTGTDINLGLRADDDEGANRWIPRVGSEKIGESSDHHDTEAHGSANKGDTTESAYDRGKGDQQNGIRIDVHDPSIANCDCSICRGEHSWHVQSPGTSSESWSGLPRAEGAALEDDEDDEHEDDLKGEEVAMPKPPQEIRKKQKEQKDLELVQSA